MAIKEGRWDCQYCGTIGNLGRHRNCKNCNHSRPEGTRFYLADDAEVADKTLQRQALVGPDWVCDFCGTSNAADINVCGSCGAPREGTSPVQKVTKYDVGKAPKRGDMSFDEEAGLATSKEKPKAKFKLPTVAIIGIAAVAVICLGVVAFLIFGGRDADATVNGFQWERTVNIEAYKTITEEDWSLPTTARLISQREEIHHYDQVVDHYETRQREVSEQVKVGTESYVCGERDLGNGFFEDVMCDRDVYETQSHTETYDEPIYISVPVYQTMYVYDIDKWIVDRTEVASGRDHQPYWPRADLDADEREGEKTETYVVEFIDSEDNRFEWETSLAEWQKFEDGQSVILALNAMGEIKEVTFP